MSSEAATKTARINEPLGMKPSLGDSVPSIWKPRMKYSRTNMAAPATAGAAIEVPESDLVAQEVPDEAELVAQPGAKSSGLRLPSGVGPAPPEQKLPCDPLPPVAPTPTADLAFSGLVTT